MSRDQIATEILRTGEGVRVAGVEGERTGIHPGLSFASQGLWDGVRAAAGQAG